MHYLKDLDVADKRVLIRADLNVPQDETGKVTDANRIKEFLPTLQSITARGGKAIVCSHLGSPTKADPAFSLKPIGEKMSELLGTDVMMAMDCIGPEVERLSRSLKPGQVLLLENLRFHPGESKNDPTFSEALAKLGDVFVQDAFATAHRSHASMVGVPRLFTSARKVCGFLIQKELEYFDRALLNPKRPLAVVLGGAKVSSKLQALINIADKADILVIGGAMANTFLAAQGVQMGRSLFEPDLAPKVLELLGNLARRGCKVYLPVDFMAGPGFDATPGLGRAVTAYDMPADMMALDIGPATRVLYREALATAETILWNGPMGAFEKEEFSKGTTEMIETIASSPALSVVGGGDTDAAIHQMELGHKFGYLSTAGGAFLALLEGNPLPGIKALE